MTLKQRKITFVLVCVCIIAIVALLYPLTTQLLKVFHDHDYRYSYFPSRDVVKAPIEQGESAQAVPILMYHGVLVRGELGINTTREQFISHMEMLKKEGYQTISINEYDLYRQGDFVLPAKPIIITFDDGRKDSYYTVDKIFEKLGFKATIFIASIKANQNDPFFLSWNELKKIQKNNRWEIEAHGRHSHDVVIADNNGTEGRYLTSRIYNPINGLESAEDFDLRIENDYKDSIDDLYNNLGISAQYYAIPLSDYGENSSNYSESALLNLELTKKYFKFAFVQNAADEYGVYETFYNYIDTNPYSLKRLDVRNISAEDLKYALEKYAPSKPQGIFPALSEQDTMTNRIQIQHGNLDMSTDGITIHSTLPSTSARVVFGDKGWKNYSVDAVISRDKARSASLIMYYLDEDNMVLVNWDQSNIKIIERIDGIDKVLFGKNLYKKNDDSMKVSATIKDSYLSVNFNGVQLINGQHIDIPRGAPGFGVWDPEGNSATLTSFQVTESK